MTWKSPARAPQSPESSVQTGEVGTHVHTNTHAHAHMHTGCTHTRYAHMHMHTHAHTHIRPWTRAVLRVGAELRAAVQRKEPHPSTKVT